MKKHSNINRMFNALLFDHLILNLTNCLCNIASGYIAGNFLDSIAISLNSLFNPLNLAFSSIAGICTAAAEIFCGEYMGVGDKKSINKTFTHSIVASIVFGLFFTFVSLAFSYPIIKMLGGSSDMLSAASAYLNAFSIGIVSTMLISVFTAFLHIENESKYVTVSVIIMTVSYLLFGYLFIKVLNLGYFGFGLTTSMSKIITSLFLLARIIKNKDQIKIDNIKIDFNFLKQMLIFGLPSGTAGLMLALRNVYLNSVLVKTGGVVAIASLSIMINSISLVDALVTSVIQTTIMISSICIGEKNKDELVDLIRYIIERFYPLFLLFVFMHIVLSNKICSIFSSDPECIKLASIATMIYCIATMIEIINDVIISLLTIFEHKKFVNILNILHCVVLHSLFTFLTSNLIGAYSVFYGYIFTELSSLLISCIYITVTNHKPINSYDDFILTNTFENVIKYSKSIVNIEDVNKLSYEISSFCKNNNIDKRRSNLVGLCSEEMIVNVFEHGFTKKKNSNKKVDIYVIIENDHISIRIRDNSIPFDPNSRKIIFDPNDPCKNIGLRIIKTISNEMTYQNIFGLNNTIVKI